MTMPIAHKKMLEMRELVIKVADRMDYEKMKERIAERDKPEHIVDASEFCELFCCKKQKIREWRIDGMPYIKDGNGYLYDVAKCHAWFRGEV